MSKKQMRFERNATESLKKVSAVFSQRGGEYADTWENGRWLALIAVAKSIGISLSHNEARRIGAAAMFDVKYSRLEGGYKEDSIIDGIAYAANLIAEMAIQNEQTNHSGPKT